MATATTNRNWSSERFHSNFQEIEVNPLEEGATALMYACQQENVEHLQSILKKKPEAIRDRDRTLKTVLHYCAENVTLSCAELVLNAIPDIIDVADEDGYTTLHLAVIAGNVPLVNFLISKYADINALDSERHSVIHWATVCGEVELLEILLKCGANPSTPDVHGGYPIHYAAQMCGATSEMGNDSRLGIAVLRVLINHNIDVNVVDHDGRQPVLWAASAGSSDAAIALINAGASVHARDKDGLTALHCAASRGHTDCLETLIELCAAEVDVIDNNGCSPLFYSVTLGHADATQFLLQCDANPNRQDRKGRTPAHCGAAKGQFETLRILKKHGGNLWIRNMKGDYCLHEAVNSGKKDLVMWLLSQRPDSVNASNCDGRCPLHIAAITNNIEMCKILLDYQSLVNPVMRNNKGELTTPLDAALHKSNRGCAKYLQLHGGVPASKLTSYSAALRGPRRVEIHSDYQGSPEGKLETPYQPRGSRSLDTSPSGYQSSRSRKVQVHIRADVTSRKVEEAFNDVKERHYKHTKKFNYDSECHPRRSMTKYNRTAEEYSFSNNSFSSGDATDYSSEADHRMRRRRRRKWYGDDHRNVGHRTCSRTRKCCRSRSRDSRQFNEDKFPSQDIKKFEESENKTKVKFQKKNDVSITPNTNAQAIETKMDNESRTQQMVTVLVHREDEKDTVESTKPSESSENGYQELQYQKLETDVTDTDVFVENYKSDETEEGAKKLGEESMKPQLALNRTETKKNPVLDGNKVMIDENDKEKGESIDPFGEKPFITENKENAINEKESRSESVFAETESKELKQILTDEKIIEDDLINTEVKSIKDDGNDECSNVDDKVIEDEKKNYKTKDEDLNFGENARIVNTTTQSQSQVEKKDAKSDIEIKELQDPENAESAEKILTNVQDISSNENQINNKYKPLREEENLNVIKDGESNFNDGIQKPVEELQKLKTEKLEEYFTKDKGLICVILDDDETIEIKRKKDSIKMKNDCMVPHRTRSANRKKEKNLQKRQRRSRSSFEILSDEGNNENEPSRLTVHDDSGFEPSPRHGSTSTFEDVSNKTKSRIPQATNRYQSQKQKENDPNITVSSVTQAVQNNLRKYHLERRVFHTLLELKRLQIRAGKSNEQILVKRLVDEYQKSGLIVGLRLYDGIYSFRHFERYLYEQLRILQSANRKDIPRIKSSDDFDRLTKALKRTRAGKTLLENVPDNPLFCTHGTHRCLHATHAYTGIPCAAYIAKLDHHKLPKTTDSYRCFLPRIDAKQTNRKNVIEIAKSLKNVDPSKPVTLELIHGTEKQIISLPTEKLDKNKRYYITFTIKGTNNQDKSTSEGENDLVVAQTSEK